MLFQTVDKRNFVNSLFILKKIYYNKNVRLLIVPKIKLTSLTFLLEKWYNVNIGTVRSK